MSLMKNDLQMHQDRHHNFLRAFLLCAGQHLCRVCEESVMDGVTLSSN